MRVKYNNRGQKSYGEDTWNGWRGRVLAVDKGTTPWEFVRVQLQDPRQGWWQPITWTERENLRKLPGVK